MILRTNTSQHDPEVQNEYNELSARLGELRADLGAVNVEMDTILGAIGKQVSDGADWQKSIAKVGKLRLESEGLEAGIRYINGQIELLKRSHYWLTR